MRPIIDDIAWSLVGTLFYKVEAKPAALAAENVRGVHADAAQNAHAAIAKHIGWQSGNEARAGSQQRQRGGHIGFRAGKGDVERAGHGLHKTQVTGRAKPAHDFSEGDDGGFHVGGWVRPRL